jgi:hypothetical protein
MYAFHLLESDNVPDIEYLEIIIESVVYKSMTKLAVILPRREKCLLTSICVYYNAGTAIFIF